VAIFIGATPDPLANHFAHAPGAQAASFM